MKGEEFVRKILAGEKDFSRIKLEDGFDLAGYKGFTEMQEYLIKNNLQRNPLLLDSSELIGINAYGLYLPFVRGSYADLRKADLREAYLTRACLWRANLREACLWRAKLGGADLWEADLWRANLREVNLRKADLKKADLREADLGVADLEGADLWKANLREADISRAYFRRTDFEEADLRGVKNLEDTLSIDHANFYKTRVTEREKAIIEEALKRKQLFFVE